MAMMLFRPEDKNKEDIVRRYFEWREKYLSIYMDLDEKWMDFVSKNEEK